MTTVLESLNSALHDALASDERVVMLGEDILDPYGGAFKVTRGLSTKFPHRTITTPVSEAGIMGVATGMALRGLRPVVEIMFGDFLTLIADQIINHATKFRYMYNGQVRVPLVIRVPMGGRRGYGPTHSQTLEKLFMGTPGLRIIAINNLHDPGLLLSKAILEDDDPVLFIENKILYSKSILDDEDNSEFLMKTHSPQDQYDGLLPVKQYVPALYLRLKDAPVPRVTIATYGYMAELCRQAALQLAYEYEIFVELVVVSQLTPFDIDPIHAAVQNSHQLLVVEEGTYTLGWGAEILALSIEKFGNEISKAQRIAAFDSPIPASIHLETTVLPDTRDIVEAVKKMV
jgi:pyruvate/2-oxoglutarate/acetoin dehydrogenase E1 component